MGAALLELAPRVVVEARGVIWADGRGLPAERLAHALLERLDELGLGAGAGAGVALTQAAAEAAALVAAGEVESGERGAGRVVPVEPGRDREFLAPLPLALFDPDPHLALLLEGVGIERCGELAALDREAVEVRFGPEGVALWRRARAEDARPPFGRAPRERPRASLDFVDYVLTDPARLVFAANALLGGLCEGLRARGEHARSMTLELPLANGQAWRRVLRPARPTASRAAWLRLIRTELERLTVPDAVTGVALDVGATEAAAARQGDLFDRGFATAEAVEQAVARLLETQGDVVVRPEVDAHPLAERRTRWVALDPVDASAAPPAPGAAATTSSPGSAAGPAGGRGARAGRRAEPGPAAVVAWAGEGDDAAHLTLQLLAEPRRIHVETVARRDHRVPVRYRDGRGARELVTAAGPDRVSGDRWSGSYAREYFRCVTADGVLVWLFRDAQSDEWYLQGWWD